MLVTESEALKRWCPFARIPVSCTTELYGKADVLLGIATGNRSSGGVHKDCMCLASGCAAWRIRRGPDGADNPPLGYCGLAGNTE